MVALDIDAAGAQKVEPLEPSLAGESTEAASLH